MQIIKQEKFAKKLRKEFNYSFDIEKSGLYLLKISGSAKSWQQNLIKFSSFFKDDDLTVKIDEIEFPKLNGKKGLFDGEVAWNGNNLKGLNKTNFFLINLEEGEHKIQFLVDQTPYLEEIEIFKIEDADVSLTEIISQPEDDNRRQWLTIILINQSLEQLSVVAKAEKRKKDDDDLKLIIDGQIQQNTEPKSHKDWFWCGRTLEEKTKEFSQELNLSQDLHYIEFWADRMPKIEKIELNDLKNKILGKIVLYSDITTLKTTHLWSGPSSHSRILDSFKGGEKCEILEARVIGEWVSSKSYIWCKVKYQNQEGYVLSSFIEIDGQERQVIIRKIKEKAKEMNIDENLVLSLAGCESRYKPYATSSENLQLSAKGIFQLTDSAITQLKQNNKEYYFEVNDPFNVNQNIRGGIRYLKWLYDVYYKGVDREVEKLIAAYNQGQKYFPPNELLDYSQLPTKEKQEEAERAVKCVLENKERKKWKSIFWPIAIVIFLIAGGSGVSYLNKIDFFEPVYSEDDYLKNQLSNIQASAVIFNQDESELFFVNQNKKIVKRMPTANLNVDEIFNTPPDIRKWRSIFIESAIEKPQNTFYFLVATSWTCGANNCGWTLYKYDIRNNSLGVIDKDILGATELYLSPNSEKLALISHINGGFCNIGGYLRIIDLNNFKKENANQFKNESDTVSIINKFRWTNNDEVELETYHRDCSNFSNSGFEKSFSYNIKNKELKLISEKIAAEP